MFSAACHYTQKNPWIHLMLSKRIDTAIDEVRFLISLFSPSDTSLCSSAVYVCEIMSILGYRKCPRCSFWQRSSVLAD